MARKAKKIDPERLKRWLDDVFATYHHRCYLHSDPLVYVHAYSDVRDQEIAGLISASLAYGQVVTINKSIARVLGILGDSPHKALLAMKDEDVRYALSGFRHRWTSDTVMADLLLGVQRVLREHGSLGELFALLDEPDAALSQTLALWVPEVQGPARKGVKLLLADSAGPSACKRLHLFLRWMIRRDEIDPGCWSGIHPQRLLMPLDTHVHQFARACGITQRSVADRKAVDEVTAFFQLMCPEDPVRYDFSLTRLGIIEGWQPDANKINGFNPLKP